MNSETKQLLQAIIQASEAAQERHERVDRFLATTSDLRKLAKQAGKILDKQNGIVRTYPPNA